MSSLQELQALQFNIKFVGKQFSKSSKTSERDAERDVERCKQAMQKGNLEVAKIYAQSSIRKKNESVNFVKLSARMEAVASRLDTAVKMKMVTRAMGTMVRGMDKVLQGMNPEHISRLMDTFEQQFENVDVASDYMQEAIGQSASSSTPDSEVTELLQRVADTNGLDLKRIMASSAAVPGQALPAAPAAVAAPAAQASADPELDALSARVAALTAPRAAG
jgi:charged multivesicular body protein 1